MSDIMAKDERRILYLNDFVVGQRFTTATMMLDEDRLVSFAKEFDPQPFHTDDAAAKESLFGGLAGSGWHTAAITMRLLVTSGPPVAGGIIGVGGEIFWPRPTRPGDILNVESEVIEISPSKSRPERGMLTLRSETKNERGEVVQVFTAKLVVPMRPQTETAQDN